jgi:hypothetical protein
MGWVVEDCIQRLRKSLGCFRYDQWPDCAEQLGLTVTFFDLPCHVQAYIIKGHLIVSTRWHRIVQARAAWHEIGHYLLHAGSFHWWMTRPQGNLTVTKFEVQANLFAERFPIWSESFRSM